MKNGGGDLATLYSGAVPGPRYDDSCTGRSKIRLTATVDRTQIHSRTTKTARCWCSVTVSRRPLNMFPPVIYDHLLVSDLKAI